MLCDAKRGVLTLASFPRCLLSPNRCGILREVFSERLNDRFCDAKLAGDRPAGGNEGNYKGRLPSPPFSGIRFRPG